jgi:hypothetical protein
MIVGVGQHVKTSPLQLRCDLRRGCYVDTTAIGLSVSPELVDDGFKVGDGYIRRADLLYQFEKGGMADVGPGPNNERVAGQNQCERL